YADQYCRTIQLVLGSGEPLWSPVTYHSHQCVELLLKAWWVKNSRRAKKTHALEELAKLLPAEIRAEPAIRDAIKLLDALYWRSRYPPDAKNAEPDDDLMD